MEVQKDFQLLDDDDDLMPSSHNNYNNNNNPIQLESMKNNNNNNPMASSAYLTSNQTSTTTIQIESNKSPKLNRYNISPNRPNPNSQIELKPIERRRSQTPLRLKGIEECVQNYAITTSYSSQTNNNNNYNNNKITMNLKMDDLLANVKNESSYQTLSDFSIMTGEQDNSFEIKNRLKNYDNNNEQDLDNQEADFDEDEDEKDDKILKYKYTASYKIDEATGSFQEQSKIIFENKSNVSQTKPIRPPPPPPPASLPKQAISVPSSKEYIQENSKSINNEDSDTFDEPSQSAQAQLALALEALRNNSQKLELKLDKIDDITISSAQYYDIAATGETISTEKEEVKKKNDSFFNDILSKSDDLLTQTQQKLDKLSKLESLVKPFAPIPPPQPVVKPKPQPSIIVPQHPSSSTLNPLANNSINNSKSLIDLKSSEVSSQIELPTVVEVTPTQVDLLFDINDSNIQLNTEPLKLGASYFDLIGLSTSNTIETTVNETITETTPSAIKELADLDIKIGAGNDSIIADELETNPAVAPSLNFSINNLDKIEEHNEVEQAPPPSNTTESSIQQAVPAIDILITEPVNEKDDNNIVPDGFFNLRHEIPKDYSRPASPSPSIKSNTDQQVNETKPTVLTPLAIDENKTMLPSLASLNASPAVTPVTLKSIDDLSMDFFIGGAAEPESVPSAASTTTTKNLIFSSKRPSRSTSPAALPSPLIARARPKPNSRSTSPSSSSFQTPIIQRKSKQPQQHKKVYSASSSANQTEESSSSSEEDEEKFKIKIGEQTLSQSNNNTFVPLLSRPPQSADEIEQFRQRRLSSDTASITRSIKDDSESSDDGINRKTIQVETVKKDVNNQEENKRKDSIQSEFNLELPDEDDSLPLPDFNDKFEVKQYADGTYGCIVLVRQPFRSANIMYKNALQKFTEVRTWTECLVKLVDSPPNGKKLLFYNAHELITLAATADTTVDKIIDIVISNEMPNSNNSNHEETNEEIKIKKIYPFHEIELKSSYKFSELSLQQYDSYTKIHTFKLQEIIFKETIQIRPDRIMALPTRFLNKFTKAKVTSLLDHTPIPFEICKFAHLNYSHLQAFLSLLQDTFWKLPTMTRKLQREQQLEQLKLQPTTTQSISAVAASIFSLGTNKQIQTASLQNSLAHTREQVTIKAVDEYKCKLDKESRIKEHRSRTRIFIINFINDAEPVIEVGLNDCLRHGKEIVGRRDIIPIKTEQWISPELFELNENVVDKEEFEKTHSLKCVGMPDNLLVEIMRFRTRPRRNYELPLQVRCYMTMVNRQIQIQCECTVSGSYYTNSDVHCADIQIRFPIPDVWVYLFRVQKTFHYGAVHSSKHKFGKLKGLDRFLAGTKSAAQSSQGAMMEASCGKAKYEQAFRSLVWRIEQLPAKNKDIYKRHMLICKLNLQEYDALPENYEPIAKVQYQVSTICASSKSQVRSISVHPCDEPPEKWVKLKSKFDYDLEINYSFDQVELPAVDKENCAELQHISQTESEGDNDENEDNDD